MDEEGGILMALEHENSKKRKEGSRNGGRKKHFFLGISGFNRLGQTYGDQSEIDEAKLWSGLDVTGRTCAILTVPMCSADVPLGRHCYLPYHFSWLA